MKKKNAALHLSSIVTSASSRQSTGKSRNDKSVRSGLLVRNPSLRMNYQTNKKTSTNFNVLIFTCLSTATTYAATKKSVMQNIKAKVSQLPQSEKVDHRLLLLLINLHHIPKRRLLLSHHPRPQAS
jgi:endonuclease III